MDFSEGIPESCRTLVVIPSMFSDKKELDDLFENLEVRFLANRDPNIHFALLTDFNDASEEKLPGEDELLRTARSRTEELNKKYGNDLNGMFFIFHRPKNIMQEKKSGWVMKESVANLPK